MAKRLGRHPGAVRKQLARIRLLSPEDSDDLLKTETPRPGRKKRISKTTLYKLRQTISDTPFLSARDLKSKVAGLEGFTVRSIQRFLKDDLKLSSYRAAKKPLLTKAMKKKRLAFCKRYRHWGQKEWMDVMYSDESTFRIINFIIFFIFSIFLLKKYLLKRSFSCTKEN